MTDEVIAIRKALECAISNGWKNMKVFSDAKIIIFLTIFDHVDFIYNPRCLNKISHRLAKFFNIAFLLYEISWVKFFSS
ncbi:hypothetical protein H5410_013881 [Solanum commersonii]|uniref:Uncharacterized protein n=1 Tax=Solanum commersonii TaxID=4109 RepID=A0A9J5ZPF9_SOLCO|nr:hypothetical protein H5410_013881 [Solanum commersonii]